MYKVILFVDRGEHKGNGFSFLLGVEKGWVGTGKLRTILGQNYFFFPPFMLSFDISYLPYKQGFSVACEYQHGKI